MPLLYVRRSPRKPPTGHQNRPTRHCATNFACRPSLVLRRHKSRLLLGSLRRLRSASDNLGDHKFSNSRISPRTSMDVQQPTDTSPCRYKAPSTCIDTSARLGSWVYVLCDTVYLESRKKK